MPGNTWEGQDNTQLYQEITAFQWLQFFSTSVFLYGMLSVGGLYLIWVAWKRREHLTVTEGSTDSSLSYDSPNRLTASERLAANCLGGIALGWITIAVIYNLVEINSLLPGRLGTVTNRLCITTILLGSGAYLGVAAVLGVMRYRRGTLGADTIAGTIGMWVGIVAWLLLVSPVIC
jgi:hypothetical protein